MSGRDSKMCIYTNMPDTHTGNMLTLAWLVDPSTNGQITSFSWTDDWGVFWLKTGLTAATRAVNFVDIQRTPADPSAGDAFILSVVDSAFTVMTKGPTNFNRGSLYIDTTSDITNRGESPGVKTYVGLTLNGKPCIAAEALPNTHYTFTTAPVYFIGFGDFKQGYQVNVSTINNPKMIVFPTNGDVDCFEAEQSIC